VFLLLPLPALADCPPILELPAAVASSRDWSARVALSTCTEREADEQAHADQVTALLKLLETHHPEIERGPLRGLVEAAASGERAWVEQAMRSARLGRSLPERNDDDPWHDAVPMPVPEGTALPLDPAMDPELVAAVKAVAPAVGWAVGGEGPSLSLTLGADPEPAKWGKHLGYAVEMSGAVGDQSVDVDGFAVGPMCDDVRQRVLQVAVAQVLADQGIVTALAPDVHAGPSPTTGALERTTVSEVCVFRRPDNAGLPVKLAVGELHEVAVATARYGCFQVPTGMSLRSTYGARVVGDGTLLIELTDKGEPTGRFRIADIDQDTVDKMLRKEKVESWAPALRPRTDGPGARQP